MNSYILLCILRIYAKYRKIIRKTKSSYLNKNKLFLHRRILIKWEYKGNFLEYLKRSSTIRNMTDNFQRKEFKYNRTIKGNSYSLKVIRYEELVLVRRIL